MGLAVHRKKREGRIVGPLSVRVVRGRAARIWTPSHRAPRLRRHRKRPARTPPRPPRRAAIRDLSWFRPARPASSERTYCRRSNRRPPREAGGPARSSRSRPPVTGCPDTRSALVPAGGPAASIALKTGSGGRCHARLTGLRRPGQAGRPHALSLANCRRVVSRTTAPKSTTPAIPAQAGIHISTPGFRLGGRNDGYVKGPSGGDPVPSLLDMAAGPPTICTITNPRSGPSRCSSEYVASLGRVDRVAVAGRAVAG